MAILEILKYPEPILSRESLPLKNITGETAQLVNDLMETMYAAPGVGLAAPQVGVAQRVIVLDVDHENPHKQVYKLINPIITRTEGEVIWEEGCLSVVDFTAEVRRAAKVEVVAFDEHEKEIKVAAEGLFAVALQHEIDHLNGRLLIDMVGPVKREMIKRKMKRAAETGEYEEARE